MAEVKWIKLATEIFDNRKIKQIECLPDGDGIIVIWFKLLCLAGNINDNGMVYFTKDIPYTDQMLSAQFNRPITLIQLALETFKRFEMVEIVDDILHVSNWEKYQNVDRLNELREYNRIAKQKSRAKQKLLQEVNDKSMTSQTSQGTDIDTDKEEETDKEEKKKDKYDENFEKLWKLLKSTPYDRKSAVTKKRKKELFEMGFERVEKAISVYQQTQNPSFYFKRDRFFNEIVDNYLDKEVSDFANAKKNSYSNTPQLVTINGKEYEYRNGKYYDPKGNGIAVDPYAEDDLPF